MFLWEKKDAFSVFPANQKVAKHTNPQHQLDVGSNGLCLSLPHMAKRNSWYFKIWDPHVYNERLPLDSYNDHSFLHNYIWW